ncbi:MAG: peptidylprolyl isomerase [Spirosomataceae bacterium]
MKYCRLFFFVGIVTVCAQQIAVAQKKSKKEYLVTLSTNYGDIKLILFDQTPLHKANFLKLVNQKFYDGLLFHRVIENFMIQGGDPSSRNAKAGERLGNGGSDMERIPAEFVPELFHQKGALAAARDNNPEKKSSACQFYIVQGKVWNDDDFAKQLARPGVRPPTEQQKQIYKTLGGSPHLDGGYTVFGQAIAGLAVVDSIAKQPRDQANRPNKDVKMTMKVKKMRKKKITRLYGYQFE